MCLPAYSGVTHVWTILVTQRVSYERQGMLSFAGFGGSVLLIFLASCIEFYFVFVLLFVLIFYLGVCICFLLLFVFVLHLVCSMFPVYLDCHF